MSALDDEDGMDAIRHSIKILEERLDNKITCSYCGEKENPKQFVVWVNGVRCVMWFCDNTCASYYQMGAEG